jgi:L-ascorbate metabolism protein UlaG (beta-lactamase superfamily)
MKITKFGHCCLLIEENGVRILTDPGVYSAGQNDLDGIDVVLVTHDHPDHLHVESLKSILARNPEAKVVTHAGLGAALGTEGIAFTPMAHGERFDANGVPVEGFGAEHAPIHVSLPPMGNIGFLIANRLFYPGDAFTDPEKAIDILALPVAGPWLRLSDAIDYALKLKPAVCFPVHDGILVRPGIAHAATRQVLESSGIAFSIPEIGKAFEI